MKTAINKDTFNKKFRLLSEKLNLGLRKILKRHFIWSVHLKLKYGHYDKKDIWDVGIVLNDYIRWQYNIRDDNLLRKKN